MTDEILATLGVMRLHEEDDEGLQSLCARVLQRAEELGIQMRTRRHELLWFVISFSLLRRPAVEHDSLREAARESQSEPVHQEEVIRMFDTLRQTWEQELLTRGRLLATRENLCLLMEERFGPFPPGLAERIEATDDLERLRGAMRQVLQVSSPDELDL
jgi:hypothetical protein